MTNLGQTFMRDLKWKTYIKSVSKITGKMAGSFNSFKKYFTPNGILYIRRGSIVATSTVAPLREPFPPLTRYKTDIEI